MHMCVASASIPDPQAWVKVAAKLRSIYSPPLRAEATWSKYRQALGLLIKHAPDGPETIDESTIADIIHDLTNRNLRLTTINSLLRVERAICAKLAKWGYIPYSPLKETNMMMRVPRGYIAKKAFRPEQMAKVLNQADREYAAAEEGRRFHAGRIRALLYLVAYTGMRAREALYVRCEHVHIERRVVEITETDRRQKTLFSAAPVPIPEEAIEVLRDWKRLQIKRKCKFLITCVTKDSPWDSGLEEYRPTNQLRRLAERAGVEGMTLASLRHTYVTNAKLAWGLNRDETKQILRHTSEDTQEHYTHDDIDHLVDRVKDFTYRPKPDPEPEQKPPEDDKSSDEDQKPAA